MKDVIVKKSKVGQFELGVFANRDFKEQKQQDLTNGKKHLTQQTQYIKHTLFIEQNRINLKNHSHK